MKFTFLILFNAIGIISYSQESPEARKERIIRLWNEKIEAQDHLEPEQGDIAAYKFSLEYHSQIRSILLDTLSDSPIIRMVVLPSFSPEYVISLDKVEDNYLVTKIKLDSSIWYSRNPEQIKRSFSTKIITAELADSLSNLYLVALTKTRYPSKPVIRTHGTDYHFAATDFGIYTGTKWSPSKGTRIAELVELTEKLISNVDQKELIEDIEKLKERM